jgi:hypothetical protein
MKSLPTVADGSGGLTRYLEEIRRFPMLEPDQEYMLAKTLAVNTTTPSAASQAGDKSPASRGQDRNGLSRLWPAHRRSRFPRATSA